jgi:hypothetical protein
LFGGWIGTHSKAAWNITQYPHRSNRRFTITKAATASNAAPSFVADATFAAGCYSYSAVASFAHSEVSAASCRHANYDASNTTVITLAGGYDTVTPRWVTTG